MERHGLDWWHEGEILREIIGGTVILHEDCIAAIRIVIVFVVFLHYCQSIQQFLH